MRDLSPTLSGWGIALTRVEVKDIIPSPDILSSMEMLSVMLVTLYVLANETMVVQTKKVSHLVAVTDYAT